VQITEQSTLQKASTILTAGWTRLARLCGSPTHVDKLTDEASLCGGTGAPVVRLAPVPSEQFWMQNSRAAALHGPCTTAAA
jgi:hypothetical protein